MSHLHPRTTIGGLTRVGVLGLAIAAIAVLAPTRAQAAPLSGGTTTLTLQQGVAKALASAGVGVKPIKPAKAGKQGIAFPIAGGDLDTAKLTGAIRHSGGLRLTSGKGSLALRKFTIQLTKRPSLTAKVGGTRVRILNLGLAKAKVGRSGLSFQVSGVSASLTKVAAKAINATLGGSVVRRGLVIGTANVGTLPSEVAVLAQGDTRLTLDPGAVSLLTGQGISAAPIAPATAVSAGVLGFPITGGAIQTAGPAGRVEHSGGIELTKGATKVDLTGFIINLDSSPDLTALVGSSRVSILDLDLSGASIAIGASDGRITITSVKAKLTATAASALNSAFGTSAFAAGQLLGTAASHVVTG